MALWENYGNTNSATSYDYYQKLMEEMRKEQAAQQAVQTAQALVQPNSTNSPAGSLGKKPTQNVVQAANQWFAQLWGNQPNYMNYLNTAVNNTVGWLNNRLNNTPYTPAPYRMSVPSSAHTTGDFANSPAYSTTGAVSYPPQTIHPDWIVNQYTDTNTDDYGFPLVEQPPATTTPTGAIAQEAPTFHFGGGGGGYRRSSGGVGRAKQLSAWYQGMINWNINKKPQGG